MVNFMGKAQIKELEGKKGKFVVVAPVGAGLYECLSGIAGQTKKEAQKIANRLNKEKEERFNYS